MQHSGSEPMSQATVIDYGEVQELMLEDAPLPLGKQVILTYSVNVNLFHDAISRRSVTGILHRMNVTPVDW